MAETSTIPNFQTCVEIKPIPPPFQRMSTELSAEDLLKEQRIAFPFFRRISERKESTWIISLFVIMHLIAFAATMIVNDCWGNSHGQCALRQLGRFSFQPMSENPLLGPSASALDSMGALRLRYLANDNQLWRLFTSPCLHAGVLHLIISLSSMIFVGIHLEQEFGPLRIGAIYILSALMGCLVAALFLEDRPSVASSGPLFGLLGATLSGLIQNWKFYSKKFATLIAFVTILIINFVIGLMPLVNNFSNIGGFISGFIAGFMLLFKPQARKVHQNKRGIFEYDVKHSVKLETKLDRPVSRIVSLVIFSLLVAGFVVALLQRINLNKYCSWCKYIDCVPFWWSCSDKTMECQTMISSAQMTLTCSINGKFRVLPYANVSHARIEDICNLLCS
ncbi:Rhomboid-related intramembrane serine protease family protein [Perilla frutescens var. frutescens]|nr:Rhomboid-related intramembrane serine protease family protein [Perilla frutescens var. frutescens]